MFHTKLNVPEVAVFDLINNFHKLDDPSKKAKANQFAFDLIDVHRGYKCMSTNNAFQLSEQQICNFLSLISYMVYQECELNKQIDELRHQLNIINITTDLSDHNYDMSFIEPLYQTYFYNKQCKIFSSENDFKALFYILEGNLTYNYTKCQHHWLGNLANLANLAQDILHIHIGKIFHYIKSCQSKRIFDIASGLSKNFNQISNQPYEILNRYEKTNECAEIWRKFLEFIPSDFSLNNGGGFFFYIGLHYNNAIIFFKWLSLGAKVSDLDRTSQRKALQLAINASHKQLLGKLIASGLIPSEEELRDATETIVDFLAYKPGRNYPSIREFLIHEKSSPELLKLVIEDEENSSDEESSDDERDDFQIVNTIMPQNRRLLARGVNYYSGSYFTAQKRQNARQITFHQQTVYSRATENLAAPKSQTNRALMTLEYADQLIKSYFELLKLTPDKPELDENYHKKKRQQRGGEARFETLYYRFIQAYVLSYNDLFKNHGMQRNFNFYTSENPALSTSMSFIVACRYASGEWINHSQQFFPKVRKSTGVLKHRRLGYVEVYLVSAAYYSKHAIEIDELQRQQKIGLSRHYQFGQEVIFESSIPAEHIFGYQIFSLPKMNVDWSQSIQERYGLNKNAYDSFRRKLQCEKTAAGINEILIELMQKVTEKQAEGLENRIREILPQQEVNQQQPQIETDIDNVTRAISGLALIKRS